MTGSSDNGVYDDLRFQASLTLKRLQPRLDAFWSESGAAEKRREDFQHRLDGHWTELFGLLFRLYGARYDFFYHLECLLLTAARAWAERPDELCELDRRRINEPDWFESERVVGGAL
ncbi:MAG: amylosucrase, partial [Planctomycetales bacterium]|nr:amylosucrase [Planctomycetales bacterium]